MHSERGIGENLIWRSRRELDCIRALVIGRKYRAVSAVRAVGVYLELGSFG